MSVSTALATILVGGVLCPLLLATLAVALPAAVARQLLAVARMSVLLAVPLAVSVAVVNVLFTPQGADVLAEMGPLRLTGEGVAVATEVVVRVFTMAGAVTLFYLTTRPGALVASLQRHGMSARLTFVVHNGVAMMPRLAERAGDVTAAQRARGLDTEGGLRGRIRAVPALAAPTVLGAVREAETRGLALETRGFTRPGPRAQLRESLDGPIQRGARWLIGASLALLAIARIGGVDLPC